MKLKEIGLSDITNHHQEDISQQSRTLSTCKCVCVCGCMLPLDLWYVCSADNGVTSAVFANLIDFLNNQAFKKCNSGSSSDGIVGTSSTSYQADMLELTTIKYYAGWCIVAARRELEHEAVPRTNLLAHFKSFGSDVASSLKPCLENFGHLSSLSGEMCFISYSLAMAG
eukprot:scpid47908/ scgid25410/ 